MSRYISCRKCAPETPRKPQWRVSGQVKRIIRGPSCYSYMYAWRSGSLATTAGRGRIISGQFRGCRVHDSSSTTPALGSRGQPGLQLIIIRSQRLFQSLRSRLQVWIISAEKHKRLNYRQSPANSIDEFSQGILPNRKIFKRNYQAGRLESGNLTISHLRRLLLQCSASVSLNEAK